MRYCSSSGQRPQWQQLVVRLRRGVRLDHNQFGKLENPVIRFVSAYTCKAVVNDERLYGFPLPQPWGLEDIVQEVQLRLFESLGSDYESLLRSESPENVDRTLLRRIVKRSIGKARWADAKRRQRNSPRIVGNGNVPDKVDLSAREELCLRTDLEDALEQLDCRERLIVSHRRAAVPVDKTCKALGIRRSTYYSIVKSIHRRLACTLRAYDERDQ